MLKRICLIVLAIFVAVNVFPKKEPVFSDGTGIYTVCVGKGSSGCFYTFPTDEIYRFDHYKNISGESLYTKDGGYVEKTVERLDATLIFSEEVDGKKINYYYSPKILAYKSINGQKINLQTAEGGDGYTIGTPLIYGGY